MKKGAISVIIFYASGLGLTGLTYLIFGAGLGHGPGPYVAIPFLTFVIGIVWTVITLFNYFVEGKTDKRKGIIYSNIIAIVIFTAAIFYSRNQNKLPDVEGFTNDNLNRLQNGDTTSLSLNGALIYLKIKDSVHVDKRDSLIGDANK